MRTAVRYSLAVLTIAIATPLTITFAELLAPIRLIFLWCAILLTAILAGTGPGLLATALALLAAIVFVFTPYHAMAIDSPLDAMRITLFGVFAAGLSIVGGRMRDLADRLRAREVRYRTIVEATALAQKVWTATPEGQPDDAIDWSAIHPADAARTQQRWKVALANAALYDDEIRMRGEPGGYRWFAIKASPVRDRGRIQEWVGVLADIDDRKRHEENTAFINRASELLASSLSSDDAMRTLARLCVPTLGDWCAIHLGHDEHYQRLAAEHSDPARVALLEKYGAIQRPPPDQDVIVRVLTSGKSLLVEHVPDELLAKMMTPEQYELVSQLGLHSWIVAPMIAHGRTLGALTVVCGDSERRYSEADVPMIEDLARRAAIALDNARLYEAAEAANRAKDEFLATLSHELRTPLTAISGWAHMLSVGIPDEDTRRLAIDTIVRSAHTQGELIDDLLDLSRVVAGTLHLQIASVDLLRIVEEVLLAAKPAADARGVTLLLHAAPQTIIVRGDERRLRQIVWNLVTNAVKFTDRDGRVELFVSAVGSMARVEVTDTGKGIDPSFLPYVWDRFRQADSSASRQHGGLGLGLAVVRHLAEMHGGTVHAESEGLGRGSTFRVEIPLARADVARDAVPPLRKGAVTPIAERSILLVDDDPDARLVLTRILEQFGARVTPVESVDDALRQLDAQSFDVIVSDIAMPGTDGYTLAALTRDRIPAIAVSAIATGPEDRRRALDSGFADFVRKPVDPQELANVVVRVLRAG